MQLVNRTAIITGAGSGIGRATARRFAVEGARIVVADINDAAGMETVAAIEGEGGTARFCAYRCNGLHRGRSDGFSDG